MDGSPQSCTLHLVSTLTPQRARLSGVARELVPARTAQARTPLGTWWIRACQEMSSFSLPRVIVTAVIVTAVIVTVVIVTVVIVTVVIQTF